MVEGGREWPRPRDWEPEVGCDDKGGDEASADGRLFLNSRAVGVAGFLGDVALGEWCAELQGVTGRVNPRGQPTTGVWGGGKGWAHKGLVPLALGPVPCASPFGPGRNIKLRYLFLIRLCMRYVFEVACSRNSMFLSKNISKIRLTI